MAKTGIKKNQTNSFELTTTSACIITAAATLILYFPVTQFEFTNWDDQVYVTGNNMIRGLSLDNLRKIFTGFLMGNYHPLVLLSYATEYEISGLNAGLFHFTNVLLHIGSGWLLILCLRELGISLLSAALMSLVFLIHPFHVESVAWVTERKDVLYGIFWMAAWYAWMRSEKADAWYLACLVLFVLSCLSKGMAVTLPAALLLSDKLRYKDNSKIRWKLWMPAVFISVIFGILAVYAQKNGGNVREDNAYDFFDQIRIASWGIWFYISRTILPLDLSIFYEYPKINSDGLPLKYTLSFVIILVLLPALFIFSLRKLNTPLAGIILFLAVLFPVSQIFPVGNAMAADRYHYIPSIGLLISMGWFLDWARKQDYVNKVIIVLLIWIVALGVLARNRIMIWKNPETLWESTIQDYPEIMFAYKNLAKYLENEGKILEAEKVYRKALLQDSTYAVAWNELGVILKNRGQNDESYNYFIKSLALDSVNKEAWLNVGTWHDRRGETNQARIAYQHSLALDSNYAEVWNNYANSFSRTGTFDSADIYFRRAIQIHPGYAEAYNNRGTNFAMQAKYDSAKSCFRQALEVQPGYAEPMYNMALVNMQLQNQDEAIIWLKKAAGSGHRRAREQLQVLNMQ